MASFEGTAALEVHLLKTPAQHHHQMKVLQRKALRLDVQYYTSKSTGNFSKVRSQ
jgi:hypothetical protein